MQPVKFCGAVFSWHVDDNSAFILTKQQDSDDRQDEPAKKIDEGIQDAEKKQSDDNKEPVGFDWRQYRLISPR